MASASAHANELLAWYDVHARALPWRIPPDQSKAGFRPDPYHTWLSEIMLQQTTVAAVVPYFVKFLGMWPTVSDLAGASDQEVRSAWAGLGYYRRAANLQACAKEVAGAGGMFPETAAQLIRLPGIGAYTSAAIASIAFNEAVPVVDGNVERVLSRMFSIDTPLPKAKAEIAQRLETMVPKGRPGDFAQALMDLGATICKPKAPECGRCPWEVHCTARWAGNAEGFPAKAVKKPKPVRYGTATIVCRQSDGAIWCQTRPNDGLLPGMTQVPTSEWLSGERSRGEGEKLGEVTHAFTHFKLILDVYRDDLPTEPEGPGFWSKPEDIASLAWPTVMIKVLKCFDPRLARLARSQGLSPEAGAPKRMTSGKSA